TAVTAETIEKRGFVGMKDYLSKVPGVVYFESLPGANSINIRGLSLGFGETNTSVYLGEMPLTTGRQTVPDIKLVDIDRVEVLKGPQGTLYGSGAQAGTVRNIPNTPNLEEWEGSVKTDIYGQNESDGFGHSLVGVVNIPLIEDKLAVRAAPYRYDVAGYVDSVSTPAREVIGEAVGKPVLVESDVNNIKIQGVRASVLWQPFDNLAVTLMMGTQDTDENGQATVLQEEGLRDYEQSTFSGNFTDTETDYSNLLLEYDLGWAALTSSSSWSRFSQDNADNVISAGIDVTWSASLALQTLETDIFSQEIRLASQSEGPWSYVVGALYEDVEALTDVSVFWDGANAAAIPDFNTPAGASRTLFALGFVVDYQQKALFGEASYAFNEQWELTVGGRYFDYERTDLNRGLPSAEVQFTIPDSDLSADHQAETYKLNLSYTPDGDTLIYAQWSEGFRLGRGQAEPIAELCDTDGNGIVDGTQGSITDSVAPDTTDNIELGAKFSLLDNRLNMNMALFRVDWEGLPATFIGSNVCAVTNNVGAARSEGVEWSIDYAATTAVLLSFSGAYIEAEVTDDPINAANEDKTLSYAPRFNVGLGVEYGFEIGASPSFVRTDINYLGEYYTIHGEGGVPAGDYVNVDLRAGVDIDQWSLALYVKNLTDKHTILRDYNLSTGLNTRLAPRRIGLELEYTF
ncbi:TonB-dependent receptor, partial [Porticoccaceae bacterium]|nr:TonB-dependent receptor [Porticoccaceae bacterium]